MPATPAAESTTFSGIGLAVMTIFGVGLAVVILFGAMILLWLIAAGAMRF